MSRIVQLPCVGRSCIVHTTKGNAGKASCLTVPVLSRRTVICIVSARIVATTAVSTTLVYVNVATSVTTNGLTAPYVTATATVPTESISAITATIPTEGVAATTGLTEVKARITLIVHNGIRSVLCI